MQKENAAGNKMGYMPIGPLLIRMAAPMALSMLVQALYNIVDSIFVSQVSPEALTAVSLAFPVQNFMIAVASGTAVGVNALLSRSLGSKDFAQANRAASNGLTLSFLSMLAFMIFGLFGVGMYYQAQTADPGILQAGYDYTTVVCVYSAGIFFEIMLERLLQSTGRTLLSMVSQLSGAVTNLIMDPILIFGYLGFPAMGAKGAAIATVLGQFVAMGLSLILNLKKNPELQLKWKDLILEGRTVKIIYGVGIPSILMMSIGSVMTYGMNQILMGFTATAVSVFGVYFKLQSFVFMPLFGMNNAMVPIIAFNYGAKNKARIRKTIALSVLIAMMMLAVGFVIFQAFTPQLIGFFNPTEEMLRIGVRALRIISYTFLVAGFCIVAGSVFQALGNGLYSLIVSIARQLVALLPAAYLLSLTGNLDMVWLSFPIAEVISLIMSAYLLWRIYREKIAPLPDN